MHDVAILMGSKSDLDVITPCFELLKKFGISFCVKVISAHRTPEQAKEFATSAEKNGIKVIICAAGMAAHLGGVIASYTTIPVIGIPIPSGSFLGVDALLSFVQMPPGIPVAVVSVGRAGAKNAALYAVSILSLSDENLAEQLREFREEQKQKVILADKELQHELTEK